MRGGALALLVILLLPENSTAQLPCLEPVHEVFYDGCLLPDDAAQAHPWEEAPGSSGEPYIDNCQLVIPVNEAMAFQIYRRYDEAFASAQSYSMEAMVKIEEFLLPGSLTPVAFYINDGQKMAEIVLEHPAGSDEKHLVICGQAPSCFTYWLDWSMSKANIT